MNQYLLRTVFFCLFVGISIEAQGSVAAEESGLEVRSKPLSLLGDRPDDSTLEKKQESSLRVDLIKWGLPLAMVVSVAVVLHKVTTAMVQGTLTSGM